MIIGTMRLGKWGSKFGTTEYSNFINECVELGCNTFDHADIYGDYTTEAEFGKAIKGKTALRQQLKLITKCGIRRVCDDRPNHRIKSYDSSAQHIIESVDNSLKNLETDYIDTLLLHRPDYLMDPRKIADAFRLLKESGKVLNFGVSNFTNDQFNLLNTFTPLSAHQFEISLLSLKAFEDGTLNQCLMKQLEVQAWSPFGGGALFVNTKDERILRVKEVARNLADKYICNIDQIMMAFLLKHPAHIRPVLGTTKIKRVKSAVEARKVALTKMDWYDLYQASTGEVLA